MAKYFPLTRTKTKVVEVPVGDGDTLEKERLQYDNRNTGQKAKDSVSVPIITNDQAKRAVEIVTAAFAAEITEIGEKALEAVSVIVEPRKDQGQRATDTAAAEIIANESAKRAEDSVEAVVIPTADQAKRAVEDVSNSVTATANEVNHRASELVSAVIVSDEMAKRAIDSTRLETTISESAKRAVEDVSNTVTASAREIGKRAEDSVEATIVARTEINQRADDVETIIVNFEGYAESVASNTGFASPNNALGNTTNTAATLTATSSGFLGTTNNTTNGTIQLDFRDVNLGDLNITSVVLQIESQHANAGLPLRQPTTNLQYQYSTNNGGSYTTFYTQTANTGKAIRSVDLTAIIGQNQSLLSAFRVRATGNVTSGTGLGAGSTASFFRAWLTIEANRTY